MALPDAQQKVMVASSHGMAAIQDCPIGCTIACLCAPFCGADCAYCIACLPQANSSCHVPGDQDCSRYADVAYKCKGPTRKNAAIAVARLAHDEACMQRIRELHGLEIIYQYVKP